MTRWARGAGVAVLCVALLAGCSTPPTDPGPGVGFHLAQVEGGPPTKDRSLPVQHVTTPPGNGYEWTVASVDPTSRRLRLLYTDGACTGADRLAVEETATTVVIGITTSQTFAGMCAAIGIPRSTTLTLRKPLGRRALMEAATGVNDGLPTVSDPALLPDPRCTTGDGPASDVPVGFVGARTRMAPTTATKAFVCRTWWPKGSARSDEVVLTDRAEVAALAEQVDAHTVDLGPAPGPRVPCPHRLSGSWYAITFEGPGTRVEVMADEIGCSTVTNGAASGTMTPALVRALDALVVP